MANITKRPERRVAKRDPFREMTETERRFRGALSDLFNWSLLPTTWIGKTESWAPSIELVDKGDRYIARADLPGMKPEDMEVSVGEDGLTISGERKQDKNVKEEDYIYEEHFYGSFHRVIPLPGDAQTDKIEASYANGILEVTVPKSAEKKAKKIQIAARNEAK